MVLNHARIRVSTNYAASFPANIAFDEIVVDVGGLTDVGSPSKIIIPAGYSIIEALGSAKATQAVRNIRLEIHKNGVPVPQFQNYGRGENTSAEWEVPDNFAIAPFIPVTEGDEIELYASYAYAPTAPTHIAVDSMLEVIDRSGGQFLVAGRSSDLTGISWPLAPLIFNDEVQDPLSLYDPATGLITIPTGFNAAGYTALDIGAGFQTTDSATTGSNLIRIQKQMPDTSWASIRGLRPHMNNGAGGAGTAYSRNTAFVFAAHTPATDGDVFRVYANQAGLSSTESILSGDFTLLTVRAIEQL